MIVPRMLRRRRSAPAVPEYRPRTDDSTVKAAEEAARQGDLNIILGAINRRGIYSRPAAYHHAIRYLWNNYQRPLASKLARHMASNHVESAIAQYWIKEMLAIEPKIARKVFDKKFLQTYYHPEVAAQCGPAG